MKKIISFLAAYCTVLGISAQEPNNSFASGTAGLSPAPNASNLGRYAEFPVSLYTGIPGINLPLYSINAGNISVPISLSYHSKGVRVDEQASWVGLGWSLNAGGVITRAVMGMPDDMKTYGSSPACYTQQNNNCYNYLNYGADVETLYNATINYTNHWTYVTDLASGNRDGEPDKFFFNFNGYSGQFVFDKNGVPSIASDMKLQISFTRDSQTGRITSFTVVNPNGYIYTFDAIEFTSCYSNIGYTFYGFPAAFLSNDVYSAWGPKQYNSSWYLTKIQNANKTQQVNFTYTQENVKDVRDFSYDTKNYEPFGGASPKEKYNSNEYYIEGKRLSSITWTGGSISFEANHTRQDIGSLWVQDNRTTTNYALTKLSVKDANNNVIKSYLFDYSYFVSPEHTTSSTWDVSLAKRLKLLSLTEESKVSGTTNPPYQFFYDETYPIPNKASQYTDYWGFSNNNANTAGGGSAVVVKQYFYPNDSPDPVTLSRFSVYQRASHSGEVFYGDYDKSPVFNYLKAGILTKIVYPTKGYSEFEYENNAFYFMNANRTGGGLRIKKTTAYDGMNHANDMIKNYDYTLSADPSKTSGLIMYMPFFAKTDNYSSSSYRLNFYSNSISGLGTTQGGYVGYQEVTVTQQNNGKVWSKFQLPAAFGVATEDPISGGGYIYNRTNCVNQYVTYAGASYSGVAWACNDNYPYAPNPNYDWSQGSLLEERVYNTSSQLVKKTENEYTIKGYKKIPAIKTSLLEWHCTDPVGFQDALYKIAKYYHLSGWKVLSKQTVTEYSPSDNTNKLQTVTNYFYENSDHYQLTRSTSADSKGQTFETIYRRAKDYTSTTGMIADLNNQHRLNEVIETQTWLQGSPKQLLRAGFNAYSDYKMQNGLASTQCLVQQQYNLEASVPVIQSGFQDTWFSSGAPVLDSRYKAVTNFNYDTRDNPVRQSVVTANLQQSSTAIYGYGQTLPIAQVNNCKETDCGFTSFESDDYLLYGNYAANIQNDGHCGTKSYSIAPNSFGPSRDYMPGAEAQNKKFILSCWIKTGSSAAGVIGSLVLYTNQFIGSGTIYPSVSGSYVGTSIYNTNGAWKYLEVEIDLKAVKTTAGLPLTTNLGIRSFIWNTGTSVNIQVDDLRFYPKDARMSTYTYIPLTGVSSISDENSNCRFYEYDNFGRLKIVKNQNGKILEKTDYNYKP